ncbi:MAG: hypothetical protein ABJY83_21375 [Roseibium sp.]
MNDTLEFANEETAGLDKKRLNEAVARGILRRAQADRLAAFWVQQERIADDAEPVSHADVEEVRFVRGFHDIFIAIGIVTFLFGLSYGLRIMGLSSVGPGITAIAIWVLSEIFARKMRMALPSFLLTVAFTPVFFIACIRLISGQSGQGFLGLFTFDQIEPSELILPTLVAIGGAALHYLRFRVPVGLAMIAGGGVFLAAVLLEIVVPGPLDNHIAWFLLISGIACFLLAMYFDSRDLERVTVNSDKAFWLHLLAAPMIVHSLLVIVAGEGGDQGASYAFLVIGLFLTLGLMAIIVDRRAILVSGLGYFGAAIGVLMTEADVSSEATLAVTLVLLGCFILLLGSAWRTVRRTLVSPFSSTALMRFVPAIN